MRTCINCNKDVTTVGEVRACSKCHQNGTAAGIHSRHQDNTPIEAAEGDFNQTPFGERRPETVAGQEPTPSPRLPAKEGVVAKVKRAYKRATRRA